jgi:hypothetical protein
MRNLVVPDRQSMRASPSFPYRGRAAAFSELIIGDSWLKMLR